MTRSTPRCSRTQHELRFMGQAALKPENALEILPPECCRKVS